MNQQDKNQMAEDKKSVGMDEMPGTPMPEKPVSVTKVTKPADNPEGQDMEMKKEDMMEGENSNEFEIDSNQMKEIKSWEVGKSYPVKMVMTGQRLGDDGKTLIGTFKIG